jgi:hypothetical protein
MDDRRRVLDVAAPIEARPALRWERPLGREGDPREPTARVPGCLPDKQERRVRPSSKVSSQVREPDRRRTWPVESWVGVAIGIERRPDLSSGQIVEQAIESVHRLIIAQRSVGGAPGLPLGGPLPAAAVHTRRSSCPPVGSWVDRQRCATQAGSRSKLRSNSRSSRQGSGLCWGDTIA